MIKKSSWTKNRWRVAGEQQAFYKEKFGGDVSKREFFKTDNVLTRQIIKYKVTFEMTNTETKYEFFIPQGSYTIYALKDIENENQIETSTRNAIIDKFEGGSRKYVSDRVKVTIDEKTIRGIEDEPLKYGEVDYELLKFKNSYTESTPKMDLKKVKKQRTLFDGSYNLDL